MRPLYLLSGFSLLGLAGIGIVVPGMPTVIFCILALWCFKRSSPRMEAWLLTHPVLGPTLRDWERDKSMRLRTKVIAITMLWVMLGISSLLLPQRTALILMVVGACVSVYIVTRKTKIEDQEVSGSAAGPAGSPLTADLGAQTTADVS